MNSSLNLDQMFPDQLLALAAQLLSQVDTMGKKINRDQAVIEKLTHEIAQLKRLKFSKRSEQLNPQQASLLDDLIDTDIAAIEAELHALQTDLTSTEKKAKAQAHSVAGRISTHLDPSRTGQYSLSMRLRTQAYR